MSELLGLALNTLENDTSIWLARFEKRLAKLEQLVRRSLHIERPCYVSDSGLVRLPDSLIHELGLQDGGGLSFIPNKETGRYELWATEQVRRRRNY